MSEKISFTINGLPRSVEVDPDLTLLDVIRDVLDLTGAKRGCDNSTCGTCVVIVDGRAVKSCNTPIARVQGATILTAEGLAQGLELHPVQRALVESGAIQCGFCTPGIVLELVALLGEKPNATQNELFTALNKHLCRCNGYEPILDGARMAQQIIQNRA